MDTNSPNEDNRNLRNVKEYLKAFGDGRPDDMVTYLAEDAIFEIPGPKESIYSKRIEGKDNIHAFYVRRQESRSKFIKKTQVEPNFIVGTNSIIAEWIIRGTTIDDRNYESRGTNHFVLSEEGKIKRVSIYINAPLDESVRSLDEDKLMVSDQGKLALMAWSVV